MSEISQTINEKSLEAFMQQLRFRMNIIENTLQTEESGNKIAFLQGNCAGFRSLCGALAEAGYPDYKNYKESAEKSLFEFSEKDHEWRITTGKFDELLYWQSVALDVEEVLSEARKPLENRINKMKDRLFYEAEKGRELYFTKGWYCILSCFEDWCVKIHESYAVAEKDKKQSLDFDDLDD